MFHLYVDAKFKKKFYYDPTIPVWWIPLAIIPERWGEEKQANEQNKNSKQTAPREEERGTSIQIRAGHLAPDGNKLPKLRRDP